MAVLVEAISVIVRVDAINKLYPGGWPAFRDHVPNATLACDNEIARVGFMVPQDAEAYVRALKAHGLAFLQDGRAADIVVVDQQRGPTVPCDWIEFGHVGDDGRRIAACRVPGSRCTTLMTPEGWQYEGSLSQTFYFVPGDRAAATMEPLGHKDSVEIYRSKLTGKTVFAGRTASDKSSGDADAAARRIPSLTPYLHAGLVDEADIQRGETIAAFPGDDGGPRRKPGFLRRLLRRCVPSRD